MVHALTPQRTTAPVRRSEALANLCTPQEYLFRALRNGELKGVLRKPVRESGHVPGQARRLSADELDDLVAGYRQGRTVRQLAAEFRISRGVASEHLKNRGVVMRPTLLDAETRRALELHAEGLSANRIGQLIGRDPKTVRSMIRRDQAPD